MSDLHEPLHVRYRPQKLDDVIGQEHVTKALARLLKDKDSFPHAFLFVGPSGCGKTTLSRILAREIGCKQGLVEIDAATHTGIEAMRDVMNHARYQALGDSPIKFIIIDECHRLSRNTWDALLKTLEEPPKHAYWCLCTTDVTKVPNTIVTRCHAYTLRSVPLGTLTDFLDGLSELDDVDVSEDVVSLCAHEAHGSVRQAIVNLSTVNGIHDRKEAYKLLTNVIDGNADAVDLAKLLIGGKIDWNTLRPIMNKLRDENPESIRMVIVAYVQKVLLDAKDDRRVPPLLNILDAFSEPFNSSEKMAPVLLAVGGLMYEKG